ncbi:DUF6869 domain-containing protein [Modestobacter altitudinis]|uniref:DUF6869 domain-containing protein n=1 Tax=Modestobacter altitudinis TaxID=2213158 RepID=UPI00110CFEEE|nr:hypothetical protein [Modestobacter altitudinis]
MVDALVVLAEAADGDADVIGLVGAGPLEDLVSHSGNGLRILDEVDRAARHHPAFRAALRTVVLGEDVPQPVLTRLAELCPAPGLMEALNPREDESHGGTEEVPRRVAGAGDPAGGGRPA